MGTVLVLGAAGAGVYVLTRDQEPEPDLLPVLGSAAVPGAGGRFCQLVNRQIVVTIANQGMGESPATTTRVEFADDPRFAPQFFATSALAPGASVQLGPVRTPDCSPCQIRIIADADNEAQESNEDNNVAIRNCF